jgi:hypothetical protein
MLDTNPRLGTRMPATANTNGWDTVFGITFDDVNRAITNAGSTPDGFNYPMDTQGEAIEGTYSTWQVTGGSGQLLHMTLPVTELTMTFDGEAPIVRRQVSITIEVALDQLRPADGKLAVERGELVEFRLRGNNGPDEQAVVVLSVSYPNVPPSPTFPGQPSSDNDGTNPIDILNVFAKAINTPGELEKFDHAFVAVNLNSRAAHDVFKWLDPTSVAYAVTAKSDGTGVMAVLCMTEDRPAPPSQDVSPELIAEGARAGFLISKPRFLEKMLRGSLKLMFDKPAGAIDEDDVAADTPEDAEVWPRDFIALEGSGTRLTNTVELNVKNFEIEGKNEPAKLPARGFEADITDTFLTLRLSRFQHSYHKGWYDVFHDITLDTHLQLSQDGKRIELIPGIGEVDENGIDLSQPDHTAIIEKTALGRGFDWAVLVLDVVVLFASFAQFARGAYVARTAGPATDAAIQGAAKVTIKAGEAAANAGVSITRNGAALLNGTVSSVVEAQTMAARIASAAFYVLTAAATGMSVYAIIDQVWQATENGSDRPEETIPDVNIFAEMAMAPILWPEQSGFELTSVAFNGGVQMSGIPTFANA